MKGDKNECMAMKKGFWGSCSKKPIHNHTNWIAMETYSCCGSEECCVGDRDKISPLGKGYRIIDPL